MALIYVDFIGLNTFIYEPVGADIDSMISPGIDPTNPLGRDKYEMVNNYATRAYFRYGGGTFGINQIGILDDAASIRPINRYVNVDFQTSNGVSLGNTGRFNALMSRRNGPYGWPSWKQIRAGQNHLVRKQRRTNFLTIVENGEEKEMTSSGGSRRVISRYGNLKSFNEPIITSRYKPLIINAGTTRIINGVETARRFSVKTSLGNQTEFFANQDLNSSLGLQEGLSSENYDVLKNYYLNGALDSDTSPFKSFEFLRYSESIFPKEVNMYKERTRVRTRFVFPWRESRENRKTTDVVRFSNNIGAQSVWNLDADNDWETKTITSLSDMRVGGVQCSGSDAPVNWGILQNPYSQVVNPEGATDLLANPAKLGLYYTASCYYSRRHLALANSTVVNPSFPGGIPEAVGSFMGTTASFEGTAKWEAGDYAGYYSGSTWIQVPKSPFYDSYGNYSLDIKNKGKNYSLVPEFRISEKVQDYEENLDWKSSMNLDFLKITGSGQGGATADGGEYTSHDENFYETFSNSDFLKHFKILKNDHDDFADPASITLVCKALKKFLPYDGFYPAQRTVQIAEQFYSSYKNNIYTTSSLGSSYSSTNSSNPALQTIYTPLFAPGILYNTIKSGIAVDYPVFTGSISAKPNVNTGDCPVYNAVRTNLIHDLTSAGPDPLRRIPFEAITNPGPEMANRAFFWNECHPSASITGSTNDMKAIWDGGGDDLYIKMANNFFAEVPNFFLQGNRLTSIKSLNQGHGEFGNHSERHGNIMPLSYRTYGMRVKLYRTTETSKGVGTTTDDDYNLSVPQDERGVTSENFTMYSRPTAFGPPTLITTSYENDSRGGMNWPFSPPYYHGEAWADLYFTPKTTGKTSLEEILANITSSNIRYFDRSSRSQTKRVNNVAMHLESCINLFGTGQDSSIEGGGYISAKDGNETSWIIQTKFETPMLNFNHVSRANGTLTVPGYASESVPRGMWHQYGRLPKSNEGVFLQVTDIPNEWVSATTVQNYLSDDSDEKLPTAMMESGRVFSLADLCGFSKEPVRVGQVAETKLIKEAIVAVPFVERGGRKKFFGIPKDDFSAAKSKDMGTYARAGTSLREMVNKMENYVFPPQMDFLNNSDIRPFAMYIFEFEHILTQKDLSDIWQNLPPEIGTSFEEAEATVSHNLFVEELLGRGAIVEEDERVYHGKYRSRVPNNIRWMVFKVKQKAKTKYHDIVVSKGLVDQSNLSKLDGITYNWPYDYFSLVELVNLEIGIDFANISNENAQGISLSPSTSGEAAGKGFADTGTLMRVGRIDEVMNAADEFAGGTGPGIGLSAQEMLDAKEEHLKQEYVVETVEEEGETEVEILQGEDAS